MKISLANTLGCLALAILLTLLAESASLRRLSGKLDSFFSGAMLFCCYGVCVGVVSLVLAYLFNLREWLALLISLPLGLPVLVFAAKLGES
jgi:hypothetical protein